MGSEGATEGRWGRTEVERVLAAPDGCVPEFQPVIALNTGQIVGYEALARFTRDPRGEPEVWLARARGCGLGDELEAKAIRAALAPAGRPLYAHLAVNVSPIGLESETVMAALPDRLDNLVIEITENELISDHETFRSRIAALRNRGALIALDDAGAGYSGLQRLLQLRPDIVKLDKALTLGVASDAARMALIESFVRFARRAGATVCAEGVESLDDLVTLADLDVGWGQGFAIARPSPPWCGVQSTAVATCRKGHEDMLQGNSAMNAGIWSRERRMERLSAQLATCRTAPDLDATLALIAAELRAEKICLSRWSAAEELVETLAENGGDPGETRFSLLEYPLTERVIGRQEAAEVIVSDPRADPAEVELLLTLDQGALLIVPVVSFGVTLGIVEAYRTSTEPWTREEISSARTIAHQFAPVLQSIAPDPWDPSPLPGEEA